MHNMIEPKSFYSFREDCSIMLDCQWQKYYVSTFIGIIVSAGPIKLYTIFIHYNMPFYKGHIWLGITDSDSLSREDLLRGAGT